MQEKTIIRGEKWIIDKMYRLRPLLMQICSLVVSVFLSSTSVFGNLAPLGLSFPLGVPTLYSLSATLGSLFGYLVLSATDSLRYIIALLCAVSIKLLLYGLNKKSPPPIAVSLIGGGVSVLIGFISVENFIPDGLYLISEALIVGGCTYFFARGLSADYVTKKFSGEEVFCIAVTINLITLALMSFTLSGISLGRIIAFIIILAASRSGGISGGAICGISSGLVVYLGGYGSDLAFVLSLSGVCAGALSNKNRFLHCLSTLIPAFALMIVTKFSAISISLSIESLCSAGIFSLLPKDSLISFGNIFSPPTHLENLTGLRKSLVMKLAFSANALEHVTETVDKVSEHLSLKKQPNFASLLVAVENEVCKGCTFRTHCWEKDRQNTLEAILSISETVKTGRTVALAQIPENFAERCLRRERLETSLTKHYTEFLSRMAAERRITEMREVVSDQFKGVSRMLYDLSEEFKTEANYDIQSAEKISDALRTMGIRTIRCGCSVDRYGRMSIEITVGEIPDLPLNRARILTKIEDICGREFDPPIINREGKECYITLHEKPLLISDCYCVQYNYKNNSLCGDTATYFKDSKGRSVMVLSDGMGTGGRAAVDSAMVSSLTERLLMAGFGYDCTLKIINSAMLFKSSDESLATLDISVIDMFSGHTELYKAGAAPTIVRRSGRAGKAECNSLPAGILSDVFFDKASLTLKAGDILIMMSDGACSEGTNWICEEIVDYYDGTAKQLAEHLASCALRRRNDGHQDDITVMVAMLEKNL